MMRSRFQLILLAGFGSLLALGGFAGFDSFRRVSQIYSEISSLNRSYRTGEQVLDQVQSEILLAGIYVRDYLLDPSHITGGLYREQLVALRSAMNQHLAELERLVETDERTHLRWLSAEVDSYWDSMEPLFTWTPQQKAALSLVFLRETVLPRRTAALDVAREVRQLHEARRRRQQQSIDRKLQQLQMDLGRMQAVALALGIAVAVASVIRLWQLEKQAQRHRLQTEQAEKELRQLSQQLVQAQEEERKSVSRELHDEVGQKLTALRVELSNLEHVRTAPEETFQSHLSETKRLTEDTIRAVRGVAMGLRPSMLDDLGLGPALEWQAREFSRRYGVPVTVQLEGDVDALPEPHRTCVYRVVQEALTNCARHASASSIRIAFHGQKNRALLVVQDNGVGFHALEMQAKGLGLIGIQERVRELGGTVTIHSQPQRGTVLSAQLPVVTVQDA